MDVTGILTRAAVGRVHVLLVDVPGELRLRWAAEVEITGRGWVLAGSVADADVLLVCGEPGAGLGAVVDDVWSRFSRPCVRAQVLQPQEVAAVLEEAARELVRDIGRRDQSADGGQHTDDPGPTGGGHVEDGDPDMDMDMSGPGGLPLASGEQDRDGLEMDVLHVPLGPALPAWPAGLVLTCTLAGDLVTGVGVGVLPGLARTGRSDRGTEAASRVELVARVLELAGRDDLAVRAREVRSAALEEGATAGTGIAGHPAWRRVHRSACRSRSLRWSLRGLGPIAPTLVADHQLPAGLQGDVLDRMRAAAGSVTEPADWPGPAPTGWRERLLGLLPQLLAGRELAEVRLLVASLPVDLTLGADLVTDRG